MTPTPRTPQPPRCARPHAGDNNDQARQAIIRRLDQKVSIDTITALLADLALPAWRPASQVMFTSVGTCSAPLGEEPVAALTTQLQADLADALTRIDEAWPWCVARLATEVRVVDDGATPSRGVVLPSQQLRATIIAQHTAGSLPLKAVNQMLRAGQLPEYAPRLEIRVRLAGGFLTPAATARSLDFSSSVTTGLDRILAAVPATVAMRTSCESCPHPG
jgi:hypothetical protein